MKSLLARLFFSKAAVQELDAALTNNMRRDMKLPPNVQQKEAIEVPPMPVPKPEYHPAYAA